MQENKTISVIVPVYKTEKYLDRCVASLVNQEYSKLEIILVDDGSPDSCPEMCDEWAKKDSRIKVIHKENGGAFSARLAGIKIASGYYVAFVDSDDWLDRDMYSYLYGLINKYSADAAGCNMRQIREGQEAENVNDEPAEEKIELFDFPDIMKNINRNTLWSLWGKLYKKELFEDLPDLPQYLVFSEDMMMNYFIYKNVKVMAVSNLAKYNYYRHYSSAISGALTYKIIDDSVLAYNIIDNDIDKNSPAYPYSISLKITNDMFLINSIVRNNKCFDRYEQLRKDILKHKKYVFSKKCSNYFSMRHKIGVILLMFAPKLYNKSILFRRSVRGY